MKKQFNCMVCALFLALTACGNKGDLYIPKEPEAGKTTTADEPKVESKGVKKEDDAVS